MLRRFLKDSVSQLHRDVAMDAIPGLAEEMMDARIGRRHVKVRGEWNRSPNQFPHGRGPLSSACDIIIASRAPRKAHARARAAIAQLRVASMGLSEWPQGPGDHVMRTHLFSAMTNVTATEGALSLECVRYCPARFVQQAPDGARAHDIVAPARNTRRLAGGAKVRYELGGLAGAATWGKADSETVRVRPDTVRHVHARRQTALRVA